MFSTYQSLPVVCYCRDILKEVATKYILSIWAYKRKFWKIKYQIYLVRVAGCLPASSSQIIEFTRIYLFHVYKWLKYEEKWFSRMIFSVSFSVFLFLSNKTRKCARRKIVLVHKCLYFQTEKNRLNFEHYNFTTSGSKIKEIRKNRIFINMESNRLLSWNLIIAIELKFETQMYIY